MNSMRECRYPNEGRSPYIFQLNVQNHHKIGLLLLIVGEKPHFPQPKRFFFFFFFEKVPKRLIMGKVLCLDITHYVTLTLLYLAKILLKILDEINALVRNFI